MRAETHVQPKLPESLYFFGGENADVTVQEFEEKVFGEKSPAGKYAWCTDYPEEGSQWLGVHDVDAPAAPVSPPPAQPAVPHRTESQQCDGNSAMPLSRRLSGLETVAVSSWPILRSAGRFGDLSYGSYLFAFPVQKAAIAAFGKGFGLVPLLLVTVPCMLAIAFVSWHLVERPALALKPTAAPRSS